MRFQPSAPRCAWLGVRLRQLPPAQTSSTRSARVGKLLLLVPRLLLHAIKRPPRHSKCGTFSCATFKTKVARNFLEMHFTTVHLATPVSANPSVRSATLERGSGSSPRGQDLASQI